MTQVPSVPFILQEAPEKNLTGFREEVYCLHYIPEGNILLTGGYAEINV